MTGQEFASAAKNAVAYKTLYVKGCFGAPMNAKNKARYSANTAYNAKASRKEKINAATEDTFGFDCICLVKGLLWGWNGDKAKTYGGAVYKSNGVPDVSESGMLAKCTEVSADFSHIEVGEYLYMTGHCGIYIGDGKVAEATPKWNDGVQITELSARKWLKHGKLPYVQYGTTDKTDKKETVTVELNKLKKGDKGEQVRSMQQLLIAKGYSCGSSGADASFGGDTDKAVRAYQTKNGLIVDGICGTNTWPKLLGIK